MTPVAARAQVELDDLLAEQVGTGARPAGIRIWQNGYAVVLPSRFRERAHGTIVDREGREWQICARGSGGAAVAHGPGTLNVSIVLPISAGCSIERGYKLWAAIVGGAIRDRYSVRVNTGEVRGAFCSGSYDLAVGTRKVAGVAQARRGGAVLVHGTILVNVDHAGYLKVIEAVERAVGIRAGTAPYKPERVASLQEFVGRPITPRELGDAICRAATRRSFNADAFCAPLAFMTSVSSSSA